jgi:hypothetical protein
MRGFRYCQSLSEIVRKSQPPDTLSVVIRLQVDSFIGLIILDFLSYTQACTFPRKSMLSPWVRAMVSRTRFRGFRPGKRPSVDGLYVGFADFRALTRAFRFACLTVGTRTRIPKSLMSSVSGASTMGTGFPSDRSKYSRKN